jgi:hypothetical protein
MQLRLRPGFLCFLALLLRLRRESSSSSISCSDATEAVASQKRQAPVVETRPRSLFPHEREADTKQNSHRPGGSFPATARLGRIYIIFGGCYRTCLAAGGCLALQPALPLRYFVRHLPWQHYPQINFLLLSRKEQPPPLLIWSHLRSHQNADRHGGLSISQRSVAYEWRRRLLRPHPPAREAQYVSFPANRSSHPSTSLISRSRSTPIMWNSNRTWLQSTDLTRSTTHTRHHSQLNQYLECPWHAACRARASLGVLRVQRLEGSRSPKSVLCIFYRIATSGLDRRTSVVDDVGGSGCEFRSASAVFRPETHWAIHPPSMGRDAPVIFDAAAEQRKSASAAISSTGVKRPDGCFSRRSSIDASSTETLASVARSSICFCTSGVRTKPGQIALQVMPRAAFSRATTFVSPMMPCQEARLG